jgi:LuxR family maltose regulon positive regulatory protein
LTEQTDRDQQAWPAAKISPPQPRALVSRPRLLEPLNAAATAGQVSLLVAPGGSGKTSLLADWARQAPMPVIWYRLDPADRDTRRLASGLCAAVERVLPGRTWQARQALANGASEIAAIGMLIGALEGLPLALVVDDFHYLDGVQEATALWEHLLRFRSQDFALTILSRTTPLLGFVMLAAMDMLTGLGRQDLSFDAGEAAALLTAHGLDHGAAGQLAQRSDGWATGVLLLARTAPESSMRLLHARSDALMRLLTDEVLATLPGDLRRFVLESAALGPMTAEEADTLLGRGDSAEMYADAVALGLFLTPEGATYRYHDLFAEHYTGVLKRENPVRLRELRRAAADWWEECGDLPRTLRLLADDEDWETLAAVLDRERHTLWRGGMWGTTLEYVERLPAAFRTARLLALCGHAHAARGEYSEALALADAGMAAAKDEEEWLSPALLHVEALLHCSRYEDGVTSADAALCVARRVQHSMAESRLLEYRGWGLLRLGRFDEGQADLHTALAAIEASGDLEAEGRTLSHLATQLIEAGQIREGEEYLARASAIWLQVENSHMRANADQNWAVLHTLTGDLPTARIEAERAISAAHQVAFPLLECDTMVTLAELCVDEGDAVEGERHARAAAELALRLNVPASLNAALRARIAAALARRDRGGARHLIEEARHVVATPIDGALLDILDGTHAMRARAHGRAIELLGRAAERLEAVHRPHHAARAYLLRAEAFMATGVVTKAEEALNQAASLVLPLGCEGYLRPTARMTRQVLAERHTFRRLRREARAMLDRLAPAAPALTVVRSEDEAEQLQLLLEVSPFGQGRISLGGRLLVISALPPRAREALFYAVAAGGMVARDELLSAVWEDDPRGPQNLWDASRHIRRLLGDRAWVLRGGAYTLTMAVHDHGAIFERESADALGNGPLLERLEAAEQALAHYGEGGYLEWCGSLWATVRRERMAQLALRTALALAGCYEELHRIDDAIGVYRRGMELDHLNEEPVRALVRLLGAQGRVREAVREYRVYQAVLQEELAASPSGELRKLVEGMRRQSS